MQASVVAAPGLWSTGCVVVARGVPDDSMVKNPPANAGVTRDAVRSPVEKIPWRKKWQPIPVFLPGKFRGQRSLAAYSP